MFFMMVRDTDMKNILELRQWGGKIVEAFGFGICIQRFLFWKTFFNHKE